jgi:hypothetical protein
MHGVVSSEVDAEIMFRFAMFCRFLFCNGRDFEAKAAVARFSFMALTTGPADSSFMFSRTEATEESGRLFMLMAATPNSDEFVDGSATDSGEL